MGEPGGLPSMGSHRVGHDWSDLAAAAAGVPGRLGSAWSYSEVLIYNSSSWERLMCSSLKPTLRGVGEVTTS